VGAAGTAGLLGTVLALAVAAAPAPAGAPPGAAPPGPPVPEGAFARAVLEGARLSIEKKPRYSRAYVKLAFPRGDPGWERGACVDVVIRAFRHAGVDLQRLVHEDVSARGSAYGIDDPDPSIDHRRVRNLKVFLDRHAEAIPSPGEAAGDGPGEGRGAWAEWLPGDLVVWDLYGGASPNHIGIVSDAAGPDGRPRVIHHMPALAGFTGRPSEDDVLTRWRILGHYRWRGSRGDP
jgi:uncharacterized protein YijF (DUF1287 family)